MPSFPKLEELLSIRPVLAQEAFRTRARQEVRNLSAQKASGWAEKLVADREKSPYKEKYADSALYEVLAVLASHGTLSQDMIETFWNITGTRSLRDQILHNPTLDRNLLTWIETRARKELLQAHHHQEKGAGPSWLKSYVQSGRRLTDTTRQTLFEVSQEIGEQIRNGIRRPRRALGHYQTIDILLEDVSTSPSHLASLLGLPQMQNDEYRAHLLLTHPRAHTDIALKLCQQYANRDDWPRWLTKGLLKGRAGHDDQRLYERLLYGKQGGTYRLFRRLVVETDQLPEDDYPQALHRMMELKPNQFLDFMDGHPNLWALVESNTLSQMMALEDPELRKEAQRHMQHRRTDGTPHKRTDR